MLALCDEVSASAHVSGLRKRASVPFSNHWSSHVSDSNGGYQISSETLHGAFPTFGRENGCSSPRQNLSGSELYDQQAMAISLPFTRPRAWHRFRN
jgi:hypothetical protein